MELSLFAEEEEVVQEPQPQFNLSYGSFDYEGLHIEIKAEETEFSCKGCILRAAMDKNRYGCLAKSTEDVFNGCKKKHVIFTCADEDKVEAFIGKRMQMISR